MVNRSVQWVLSWPRAFKRITVLSVDVLLCVISVLVAYYLRLGEWVPIEGRILWVIVIACGLAIPIFIKMGLYRAVFRYAGGVALLSVAQASLFYGLLFSGIFTFYGFVGIPRTVGIIQPLILLFLVGLSRALARWWLGGEYLGQLKSDSRPSVLIYGTGVEGRQLLSALRLSQEMRIVGWLDDEAELQGTVLDGLPIFAAQELAEIIPRLHVHLVLLAVPSGLSHYRHQIIESLRHVKVEVRTLPKMDDLAAGKITASALRELDLEDLLGRDAVTPNNELMGFPIFAKTVLVTGAGGSIGSELCRQILREKPKVLVLVEHSEYALYQIVLELTQSLGPVPPVTLVPVLTSVLNKDRLSKVFAQWKPQTIYHAAAYKHVPLVEDNPWDGIRNNVWGTKIVAELSVTHGVSDMVLVSTDKAVRPTNIMGASKRLAEQVLQSLTEISPAIRFSMVRFGNVLGSSGSVVPLFRKQIKSGGPVTLTHPDITRFFMTIPEAAQLVIQAGAMATGGDVFVLDMGAPVRIYDLAVSIIELSGYQVRDERSPTGDIEIQIVGLRPGEKLYEELLLGNDPKPTAHARIMKAHEPYMEWDRLTSYLFEFEGLSERCDLVSLKKWLGCGVPDYRPAGSDG